MKKRSIRLMAGACAAAVLCGSVLVPLPVSAQGTSTEATISVISSANNFQAETTTATFTTGKTASSNYLTVDQSVTGQTMLGLGGAMTESAAYNISKLSEEQQEEIYEAYYGESGAKYALVRSTIGSCDFSLSSYSYDDSTTADPDLTNFSIAKDYDYVIPALKKVLEYNSDVKHFAAPWAPPAWMKKSGQRMGGISTAGINLKNNAIDSKYYQSYANYLVKYIQAYAAEGIDTYSLSMQNESENNPKWECCSWTTSTAIDFIGNYLGPTLKNNNIDTKLVIWDWDKGNDTMHKDGFVNYNTALLNSNAAQYIDGIAFHWYAGDLWHEISGTPMWSADFDSLTTIKSKFPNIHLYATESSQEKGVWFNSAEPAYRYIYDILNDFECGTECYIDWNLVLDANGGPNHDNISNPCHAAILLDSNNQICYQPSYYVLKMISRAVQPGTVHIQTTTDNSNIDKTAVIDEEGNVSVLVGNRTSNAITVTLQDGGQGLDVTLPANSLTCVQYNTTKASCTHQNQVVKNAVEATCTTEGYTGDTCCADCGELISSGTAIAKLGHNWDDGVVTKEATTTQEGVKTYTCQTCGETYTEAIPKQEEPAQKLVPTLTISTAKGSPNRRIVFTGKVEDYANLDKYYTITGHGIVYMTASRLGTRELTVNTFGRSNAKVSTFTADGSFSHSIRTIAASTAYTARAWVSYTDDSGKTCYAYSDPVIVSYSTAQ